jgi:Ca2+-binding RTX toxin-like protein
MMAWMAKWGAYDFNNAAANGLTLPGGGTTGTDAALHTGHIGSYDQAIIAQLNDIALDDAFGNLFADPAAFERFFLTGRAEGIDDAAFRNVLQEAVYGLVDDTRLSLTYRPDISSLTDPVEIRARLQGAAFLSYDDPYLIDAANRLGVDPEQLAGELNGGALADGVPQEFRDVSDAIWGDAPEMRGYVPSDAQVAADQETVRRYNSPSPGESRPTPIEYEMAQARLGIDAKLRAAATHVGSTLDTVEFARLALNDPATATALIAGQEAIGAAANERLTTAFRASGLSASEASAAASSILTRGGRILGVVGAAYTVYDWGGTAWAVARGDARIAGWQKPWEDWRPPPAFNGAGYATHEIINAATGGVGNAGADAPTDQEAPYGVLDLGVLPQYDPAYLSLVNLPNGYSLVQQGGRNVVINTVTGQPARVILKVDPTTGNPELHSGGRIEPLIIVSVGAGNLIRIDLPRGETGNSAAAPIAQLLGDEAAADPSMRTLMVQTDGSVPPSEVVRRLLDPNLPQQLDGMTPQERRAFLGIEGVEPVSDEQATNEFQQSQDQLEALTITAPSLTSQTTVHRIVGFLRDLGDAVASAFGSISFAQLGSTFGANLSRLIQTDDQWASLGLGTALATIGLNIGQGIDNLRDARASTTFASAFDDLPADLRDAGVGAVSSYLLGEFIDELGIEGPIGGALNSIGGAAINQIYYNALHLGEWLDDAGNVIAPAGTPATEVPANAVQRSLDYNVGVSMMNAVGAFVGTWLASELIEFETIGGQVGAAIGSAVGGALGVATAVEMGAKIGSIWGPIGAAIGAFVGYIVGGLIGSLFGGTPKAGAAVGWDATDQHFEIQSVWSKNGGSKDAVRSMAGQVSELLNGVIAVSGSRVNDPTGIQAGAYDLKGSKFIYKASVGGGYAFHSKDLSTVVNHGAFIALSDLSERLVGGDVYVKRALLATLEEANGSPESSNTYSAGEFEPGTLFGNVAAAQDYGHYIQNASAIHALIEANRDSAFAAGWMVTLARVLDLGLDRRWKSDWLGGWGAFLDETADGAVDGTSFTAANMLVELDAETHERLFVFLDDDGTLLGVLGDTIELDAKDTVHGALNSDVITLADQTWTETASVVETVTVAADGSFFNKRTGSVFFIDPEIVYQGERLLLTEGVWLTGEDTVEVARDVTVTHQGWRVTDSTGLTINGSAASAGPSDQIRVAALIDGGAGDDTIRGGDLGNDLIGGEGNDTLIGGVLDDWQFGGAGNDRLFAGDVADPNSADVEALTGVDGGNGDYLDGGEGDDSLYGGRGSDWLNGGAGVDRLYGGAGGDILDGGTGDDRGANGEAFLLGGAGSDQYVFYYGGGNDVVFDASDPASVAGTALYSASQRYAFLGQNPGARNWAGDGDYEVDGSVVGGEDAISFGLGIGFEDIKLRRGTVDGTPTGAANADLIIELSALDENGVRYLTGDALTVKDWFDETRRIEWLRFADGQDIRIGDITSIHIGTEAPDSIMGTEGADWVYGGGGDDVLELGNDDDFGFGAKGRDVVSGDNDNDFLSGGDDDDKVLGGAGHDTVFGDAGDDVVAGGDGNDIVAGGRGTDEVSGGAGDDLYRFWRGDGHDTMYDTYAGATEDIMVDGEFVNGYELIDGQLARNGELLMDGEQLASMGWDSLNRRLYLQTAIDSGTTTTTANAGFEDTLEFGFGIDIEDLQLMRVGDSLELAIAEGAFDPTAFFAMGDRITLRDWFSVPGQIEQFVFVETGLLDLSSWTLTATIGQASDGDDALEGAAGQDWITGGLGDDVIEGLAGDDILSGNYGADRIEGGAGADVIYGGGDNDVIDGGAGADLIFGGAGHDIASYASSTSTTAGVHVSLANPILNTLDAAGDVLSGIEGLEGTNLNDELWGDAGDNTLRGLAGDDVLKGDRGDDTYEVNAGDGDDVIRESGIQITEVVGADGELAPGYTADWHLAGIEDMWGGYWYYYEITVTGPGGGVVYQSEYGDFIFESPQQAIMPPPGAWPFSRWPSGARRVGQGIVIESALAGDAGYDTLEIGPGVSLSDITATRPNAYDVKLSFGGGSVTIQNQTFANAGEYERAVEELILDDGLTANLLNLKIAGEGGTTGDDLFLGASENDVFAGDLGNDVISGGEGNDNLSGGGGDDTLEGGAGADTLDGGEDSVTADHAALQGNGLSAYGDTIRYVRSSQGVTIDLDTHSASGGDATGDTIVYTTIEGQEVSTIENVVGSEANGDFLYGDDRANRLVGLGGNDQLEGRGGDDLLIGGAGADTILGGAGDDGIAGDAGDDVLNGEEGDDYIEGGEGIDSIRGGAGADKIYAGAGADADVHGEDDDDRLYGQDGGDVLHGDAGNDTLDGGADADTLDGGTGDDILIGGAGADTLLGGAGDDRYLFDAASGADQITDAEGLNNSVELTGVSIDRIWLTQSGVDLVIGVIGGDTQITVAGYFQASGGSRISKVVTDTHTLYLAHAGDLIAAMTLASATAPASVPQSIADQLDTYWTLGVKAAPRLINPVFSLNEDGSVSGVIGTIDPDDQPLTYALQQGPAHGTLTFNPSDSSWTYQPDADWNGVDGFDVAVTDADGQTVIEHVALDVAAVNDAPGIVVPALSVAENAADGTLIGQLAATDIEGDAVTFSQQTDASGRFAVSSTGEITVIDGALLDFEAAGSYQIEVTATDAGGASSTQTVTISLSDVNEAPTAVALANAQASLSEATSTATRVKVADLVVTDDALGAESFALSGADAASFEIFEGALYLKAGVALDYETKASYQVTVSVDDASVGATPDASQSFTMTLSDANEAPTALTFTNVTSSISDTASTASRIHIADLVVSDDALGAETMGLTGADAASFEIFNGALYLKAGVALDAGTQSTYDVSVTVDDPAIGSGPELTQAFTLSVGAGLALSFDNVVASLSESTSTASRVKVADLVVADDVGTPTLSLTGADAAAFEIFNGALYIKAGVALNYEAKTTYQVTVNMDDPNVGSGVDLTRDFTLTISDANEAPTALAFTNTTTSLAENTSTATRIKLADLNVTDDALGSEVLGLSGADAAFFEIIGSTLYLKAGVTLNFEAKASYSVNVTVDDASVGATPDISQAFTLSVTDLNEAPTSLTLTNTVTSLAENTSTATRIKVADLGIADDALGTETIAVTGADAASFEIYNGALYLKAGVALNYEAKSSYAVTVTVDDPTVGATPDLSQSFTLTVTNVNEAPTSVSFANTTTAIQENTSTATRIKMADIVVADDALGAENITLSGADAGSFEVIGGVLYLKAGVTLNYEAKSSYSVTVNVDDPTVGAAPDVSQAFTLSVTNVNEAVSLDWAASSAQVAGATWNAATHTLAVPENVATGVVVGDLAASDLDTGAFANFRFELTGANASLFTINAVTGEIALAAPLNYEATPHTFSVGVTVWDGGAAGSGMSASGTFTIDALNVNEAPVGSGFWYYYAGGRSSGTTVGTMTASDPEGSAVTFSIYAVSRQTNIDGEVTTSSLATSTYTITSAGVVKLNTNVGVAGGALKTDTITVRLSDASGNISYVNATAQYDGTGGGGGGGGQIPPIVLDLNGDGVTLVPFADSPVEMDVNSDGLADHMGWVGADDGLLALDRNGDGVIAGIEEISFAHDVEGAASDLEGLRAYDSNSNGFFDPGDAQFAEFRVWQDANQDGLAQAEEVTDLAGRQIAAINLTLTPTGQSPIGASDNVLYGTASFIRADGSHGVVGDVFLHYAVTVMQSGGLPPIVFDLDGDGVSLTSRLVSTVAFDANDDGVAEHIGWFGAGEGVLALDRNGDGAITSGSEISFVQDVEGAQTDLQGLRAYDTNANGFFDTGDARYGEFRIWQDANQDGVSQAGELQSLADWDIVAINLTLNPTGVSLEGASDNVIYATSQFVRADGTRGLVGDVYLSFDEGPIPSGEAVSVPDAASPGADETPAGGWCGTTGADKPPPFPAAGPLWKDASGWCGTGPVRPQADDGEGGFFPGRLWSNRPRPWADPEFEWSPGWFSGRGRRERANAGAAPSGWCGTEPQKPTSPPASEQGIGDVDRRASGSGRTPDPRRRPLDWISANEIAFDQAAFDADGADFWRPQGLGVAPWRRPRAAPTAETGELAELLGLSAAAPEPSPAANDELAFKGFSARRSALHAGLGVSNRRVLNMIDAMAGFEARSASDLARTSRQRDPKVAAMLTSLPDLR